MESSDPSGQAPGPQQPNHSSPSAYTGPETVAPAAFSGASVRTIPSSTPQPSAPLQTPVAPAAAGGRPAPTPVTNQVAPKPSTVRTIPASSVRSKPEVVVPHSFNDAQRVADTFMASKPVIVNLQAVNSDLSRRIIDFAAGLCYGLGGQMEKVTQAVYMLTPADVEVSAEDRRDVEQGLS